MRAALAFECARLEACVIPPRRAYMHKGTSNARYITPRPMPRIALYIQRLTAGGALHPARALLAARDTAPQRHMQRKLFACNRPQRHQGNTKFVSAATLREPNNTSKTVRDVSPPAAPRRPSISPHNSLALLPAKALTTSLALVTTGMVSSHGPKSEGQL